MKCTPGGVVYHFREAVGAPIEAVSDMSRADGAKKIVGWPGGGNLQVDAMSHVMEVKDILLVLGYEWE
jgi:hypothetical protein